VTGDGSIREESEVLHTKKGSLTVKTDVGLFFL